MGSSLKKEDSINFNFWDYKGTHRSGIHTLGHYPATMVPNMQLKLMQDWKSPSDKVMLDPFVGSGTTLVEAQSLNMEVIGIDLNPYAVLLSQVKTHDYSDINWNAVKSRVHEKLYSNQYIFPIHSFDNITKWFRKDIIHSLSIVKNVIRSEENIWVRKFLWICMSEVIYIHSNDRTSTFKLHQKPQYQIDKINNDINDNFENTISQKTAFLPEKKLSKATIYSGDTIYMCSQIKPASIDLICTSPPYGDNATTVTYGQASVLFLKWIDSKDLTNLDSNNLLSNFSKIDSLSLGGTKAKQFLYNSQLLNDFLSTISFSKQKKIRKFISDYWLVLKQLSRVIKKDGIIIFTVGNRTVDNKIQPLDQFTVEMFSKLNVKKIQSYSRHILSKQTPQKTIKDINGLKIKSMDKEKVLIFKKEM